MFSVSRGPVESNPAPVMTLFYHVINGKLKQLTPLSDIAISADFLGTLQSQLISHIIPSWKVQGDLPLEVN